MLELNVPLKIAKNTLFLNLSTILSRGLSFVTSIAIARYLGEADFGKYTFALYFTGLFIVLTDLGLSNLTVREVARDKPAANKYLVHNMIIRTILGTITLLAIVVLVNTMHYSSVVKLVIYILAFYMIGKSFAGSFDSIFFAFNKMEFTSFLNIFLTFLILIGVLFGIALKYGLTKLLLAYPFAVIIYLYLAFFLIIKNFVRPNFQFDFRFAKNLVITGIPFALSSFFMATFSRIDMVMLKTIQGDVAAGYYGISGAFISILVFIPANFIIVLYPLFSRFYKTSRESLIKYYEKSTQLLLILALPMASGGMILADRLIQLFYGQRYLPASISLQILVCALAIQFIGSGGDILMLSTDRQKTVAKMSFCLMVINIILNLILIPKFSYVGASVSALITYLLGFIIVFTIISRNVYRLNLLKLIIKPFLATLLMAAFVYLFKNKNLALIICSSCVIYISLLFALKVISQRDIDLLKQLFSRNNILGEQEISKDGIHQL